MSLGVLCVKQSCWNHIINSPLSASGHWLFSLCISKCVSPSAGWSVESLQEWGSFMKLAIPSSLMKCFEWWVYDLGGFFAGNPFIFNFCFIGADFHFESWMWFPLCLWWSGMLGEDELAAQHVVMMVSYITYMVTSATSFCSQSARFSN